MGMKKLYEKPGIHYEISGLLLYHADKTVHIDFNLIII